MYILFIIIGRNSIGVRARARKCAPWKASHSRGMKSALADYLSTDTRRRHHVGDIGKKFPKVFGFCEVYLCATYTLVMHIILPYALCILGCE